MTTLESTQISGWVGHTLIDERGEKIGRISDIYLDEDTGQPEWLAVNTGLFGTRVSFVPLRGATGAGQDLMVPFSKDHVKDAPHAEPDGHLSEEEEAALYRHYGMEYGTTTSSADGGPGRDVSGPNTDDAMTRSEEELRVGKTSRESGRVRLRKWVDTERVAQTVPVAREEVRIEREPITDANVDRAMDGPAISEEEHEVTLHEEEVVTAKQAVPKERVRLDKDIVADEVTAAEDLQKERIDVEADLRREHVELDVDPEVADRVVDARSDGGGSGRGLGA